MKRIQYFLTPMTTVLLGFMIGFNGCSKEDSSSTSPSALAPRITSYSPTSVVVGATVDLTAEGENLAGAVLETTVETITISNTIATDTSLTATIEFTLETTPGAKSFKVTTGEGATTFSISVTTPNPPAVTGYTPSQGSIGYITNVRLSGGNLNGLWATTDSDYATATVPIQEDSAATVAVDVDGMALPGTVTVTVSNAGGSYTFDFAMKPANVASISWTNGPDLPTPRYGLTAEVVDGMIYVIGGSDGTGSMANVDILDPETNTWTTGPALPSARVYHASAVLDNKIYCMGGASGSTLLNAFDMLDPSTNTWTALNNMPTARVGHGAGAIGGKVYVVGGTQGGDNLVAATESYDLASNSWTTLANLPQPRKFFATAPAGKRVYVIGGDDTQFYLPTTQYFNTDQNTWSTTTAMPSPRRFCPGVLFLGNIVIVGGESTDGTNTITLNTVEALNLETNTWSTVTALPAIRDTEALAVVGRKLYVLGGGKWTGQNYVNVAATLIGQLPE